MVRMLVNRNSIYIYTDVYIYTLIQGRAAARAGAGQAATARRAGRPCWLMRVCFSGRGVQQQFKVLSCVYIYVHVYACECIVCTCVTMYMYTYMFLHMYMHNQMHMYGYE